MAFTLAEVVTSLSILSIVCVAMGSVLVLGGRAMTVSTTGAAVQTDVAATAASRIVSDLQVALSITEATATSITFTVPDRTGDGLVDTIRYSWSGTAGNPLTLKFNGSAAISIADNIHKLDFGYLYRTVGLTSASDGSGGGTSEPVATVESAEQVLASYTSGTANYSLLKTAWPSQYFNPTFPSNAISWKITRARLHLKRASGASGKLDIQLRKTDASFRPTGTVLATTTADIGTLSTTSTWLELAFTNVSGLKPGEGVALVISSQATKNSGYATYSDSGASPGTAWSVSTDSGATWSSGTTSKSLNFRIYGTITTPAS